MDKRYQHRVSIRAELCFDLILDLPDPTAAELRDAVVEELSRFADSERGFIVPAIKDAKVFPEWNSVDPEIEPQNALDTDVVRSVDCFEIRDIRKA